MIESVFKWTFRLLWQLVFWVYVLSFTWNGKMLYFHMKEAIVDNALVASLERYGSSFYGEVRERVNLALKETPQRLQD
jgi:hypothetical protein